jgi:8-oxo-dGTP pyrophosphatase MutT (NUDIX family)
MTMICFDAGEMRFNYRVAGIALRDSQVLLNRLEDQEFWFLPGGRVEMGEPSVVALQREILEELQEEAQVGRLLWINENFFGGDKRKQYHELGLYYAINFAPESPVYRATGPFLASDGHTRLVFQWFPLESLDKVRLYPPFLVKGLRNLPGQTVHLLESQSPIL